MPKSRFEVELVFVQSLTNPGYLAFLHSAGYFADPVFTDFLAYLRYFETPPFRDYLTYPLCLPILYSLVTRDEKLFACLDRGDLSLLHDQLCKLWKHNEPEAS